MSEPQPGLFRFRRGSSYWLVRAILSAVLVCLSPIRSHANLYLRLTSASLGDIKGESQVDKYPGDRGWTEINSFSFGVSAPVTIGSGASGASAGKATSPGLSIQKLIDLVSPKIFQAITKGDKFDTAVLVIDDPNTSAARKPLFQFDFEVVYATEQSWSSGGDRPSESVTFAVRKVTMTYTPQDPNVAAPGPVEWDPTLIPAK